MGVLQGTAWGTACRTTTTFHSYSDGFLCFMPCDFGVRAGKLSPAWPKLHLQVLWG